MTRATILLVDDEPLIRWSIGERLRAEGYDVLEAENGRDALDLAGRGIDVALLDYRLPDSDGLTLLRAIKADIPGTVVFLLTACVDADLAAAARAEGADHFANKPVDLNDLVLLVARALERAGSGRGPVPCCPEPT